MNGNALGKLGLGGTIKDNKMSIFQAWVTLDSSRAEILAIRNRVRLLLHSCVGPLVTEAGSKNAIRWAQKSAPPPWELADVCD